MNEGLPKKNVTPAEDADVDMSYVEMALGQQPGAAAENAAEGPEVPEDLEVSEAQLREKLDATLSTMKGQLDTFTADAESKLQEIGEIMADIHRVKEGDNLPPEVYQAFDRVRQDFKKRDMPLPASIDYMDLAIPGGVEKYTATSLRREVGEYAETIEDIRAGKAVTTEIKDSASLSNVEKQFGTELANASEYYAAMASELKTARDLIAVKSRLGA
jgi:hypothetical protein